MTSIFIILALLAITAVAIGFYQLWRKLRPHAVLVINGESGMAIEIPLGQPVPIEFEALANGVVVPVPDSVEVTFTTEPNDAGEFTDTQPTSTTFTAANPGLVIIRGRAFFNDQEWIAEQVVDVRAAVDAVRLRVNGQVEPTP